MAMLQDIRYALAAMHQIESAVFLQRLGRIGNEHIKLQENLMPGDGPAAHFHLAMMSLLKIRRIAKHDIEAAQCARGKILTADLRVGDAMLLHVEACQLTGLLLDIHAAQEGWFICCRSQQQRAVVRPDIEHTLSLSDLHEPRQLRCIRIDAEHIFPLPEMNVRSGNVVISQFFFVHAVIIIQNHIRLNSLMNSMPNVAFRYDPASTSKKQMKMSLSR